MIDVQALIASGLSLVPVPFGRKRPSAPAWNERRNVISSAVSANRLTGMNVGLAHAYCSPTPTCAIDIDNYKLAKAWLSARGVDVDALLLGSDAVVIWSGKRLSIKLLYRLPQIVGPLPTKTVHAIDRSVAMEFRCATADGKTVQDVLPPSLHPDGQLYRWMGSGNPLALPELPGEMLALWLELVSTSATARISSLKLVCRSMEQTPRNTARAWSLLNQINADCSYETYRSVIWALESLGWTDSEVVQRAWSMTAPARFDERTLQALKRSYQPGTGHVGFGTLVHLARQSSSLPVQVSA